MSILFPPRLFQCCTLGLCLVAAGWVPVSAFSRPMYLPSVIPSPKASPTDTYHHLTLADAIYLALNRDMVIENAELGQVTSKLGVQNAKYNFQPQYLINGTASYNKGSFPSYAFGPTVTWNTPIGSQFQFQYTPAFLGSVGNGNGQAAYGTLQVTQPLLRGFGTALNTIGLRTSIDNLLSTNYNFQNTVINKVVVTVQAYRSVIQSIRSLHAAAANVSSSKAMLRQSILFYKNGQGAYSDVIQQRQTLAQNELSYTQTQNQLKQNYQTLLNYVNLPPSMNIEIDVPQEKITKAMIPDLKKSIQVALAHNINYQVAKINLDVTKTAIISAKDARKTQLTVSSNATIIGPRINLSDSNVSVTANSLNVSLQQPINNVATRIGLENANIALAQAELALANQKRALITTVTNAVINIQMLYKQILIDRQNEELTRESLHAQQIKLAYGQATAFTVTQIQLNLFNAETQTINDEISFENSITTLNQTLGVTLDEWGIKLRY